MEQICSGDLYQDFQPSQYQWPVQHHNRYNDPVGAGEVCLEPPHDNEKESGGSRGLYCWLHVRFMPLRRWKSLRSADGPDSAPVFSMIGFIVRIRISASPDVTWNDPEILLWA